MIDELVDILRGMLTSAIEDHASVAVVNDGYAARFVARDPSTGLTWGALVERGETIRINRSFRLLVEPIDQVMIRPLCEVDRRWSVQ